MTKKRRKVQFIQGNGLPMKAVKQNRNDLCKCGSGKKAKRCCGVETKYFSKKQPNQTEQDRYIKEKEKSGKLQ